MKPWPVLALLLAAPAVAEQVAFGVLGDMPYNAWERRQLPDMLREIDAGTLDFVVHVGDIKSGSSRCDDQLLLDIHAVFETSRHPLIYVPGDNEWTDCHRLTAGGHDPEERLAALRRVFFRNDQTLGRRRFPLERQPGHYRENARWRTQSVLFLTLNVPGSNNNWGADTAAPSEEYRRRGAANRDWLAQSFAAASQAGAKAVVVFIQADIGLRRNGRRTTRPDGYRDFVEQLRAETIAFAGEVLLVHGDDHVFRFDQPMTRPASGAPVANFSRLETYGSPLVGWVGVSIDTERSPMFSIAPHPWRPQSNHLLPY